MDSDGTVKVSDFGLGHELPESKVAEIATSGSELPWYSLAPECLEPAARFSCKSDAYAFGVVMWEVFDEQTPHTLMSRHRTRFGTDEVNFKVPPTPAGMPKPVLKIMNKLLRRKASERCSVVEAYGDLQATRPCRYLASAIADSDNTTLCAFLDDEWNRTSARGHAADVVASSESRASAARHTYSPATAGSAAAVLESLTNTFIISEEEEDDASNCGDLLLPLAVESGVCDDDT